ncbi:MAG TPA: outer membrane protein [Methylocella sp.]|nr:outer membrane protein [Methylocella sp.]
MRRQLLLASVGAIAVSGTAFAADLTPPPAPAPIFSWTGLYVGGQIGYAWDKDPTDASLGAGGILLSDSFSNNPQGVIGGAHIGYNLQINQWLIGFEGSVDGTSISQTTFDPFSGLTVSTRADIQGSIRARAGVAFDRVLVYATGGAAFTGIDDNYTDTLGRITGLPGVSEDISKTRAGWTVGGGLEYAVTNNWSVRAEYRYSDFGHYTDYPFVTFVTPVPPAVFGGGSLFIQHHLTENQVQVGFSYKFDSLAPVVAKY